MDRCIGQADHEDTAMDFKGASQTNAACALNQSEMTDWKSTNISLERTRDCMQMQTVTQGHRLAGQITVC